jgi:hypothetical protein
MKKLTLSIILGFAVYMAAAVAQTNPSGSQQGTPQSGPGMSQQHGSPSQPGTANTGTMAQDQSASQTEKGEKKIKGCVQSQGGQYVLENKHGKAIALAGQDVSAHVGHEVAVKGTWQNAGSAGMSQSSSGNAGAERTFNVTDVQMISESCGGKASKGSSGMGTGAGTGAGAGAGAGTGTGTTNPPQSNTPPQ